MSRRVRSALLGLAVCFTAGCTQPVVYGRLAEVAQPGRVRISGGINYGYAAGTVRVEQPAADEPEPPPPATREYAGNVASAFGSTPAAPLGIPLSALWGEVSGALGLFRPCELGALAGLMRAGLELRCALLDERAGAPFAFALAAGGLHRTAWVNADGLAFRAGLELSSRGQDASPLINVYLRYGPNMRMLRDSDEEFTVSNDGWFQRRGVIVERDELVLSVPIGVALIRGQHAIFAIVPELTLDAHDTKLECPSCESWQPSRFDQRWAIYVTVGFSSGDR